MKPGSRGFGSNKFKKRPKKQGGPIRDIIKTRIMPPLIESAANWGIDLLDGLKPETQQDLIDQFSDRAAGYVNSTKTTIDNNLVKVGIKKVVALLSATNDKILTGDEVIPKAQPISE